MAQFKASEMAEYTPNPVNEYTNNNYLKERLKDNFIPRPPDDFGNWTGDKGRSHDYYQKIPSLQARTGGLPAGAGCLHAHAEAERRRAEYNFWNAQIKDGVED